MTTQTKIVSVKKCTVVRVTTGGGGTQGCGKSKHLYVGRRKTATTDRTYTSFIQFDLDWDGMAGAQIKSATMPIYTDEGIISANPGIFSLPATDDTPKVKVRSLTSTFTDGDNADGTFNASDYTTATNAPASEVTKRMRIDANGLARIDLTAMVDAWAPKNIKTSTGSAGAGKTNFGIVLLPFDATEKTSWSGWSDLAPDSTLGPKLEIVYEPGLTTPETGNLSPSGDIGKLDAFEGDFTDSHANAHLAAAQVEVYTNAATNSGQTVSGGVRVRSYSQNASVTEQQAARANVEPGDLVLITGTHYKFRLRVQNEQGRWSNWSNLVQFTITNTVPDAPVLTPDAATYASLASVVFRGGTFSDADGDKLLAYRVQLSSLVEGDPDWGDPDAIRWDTGKRFVASGDTSWQTHYGGESLSADDYTWRAMQWDSREGESDWTYATLALSADFDVDPSTIDVPVFNVNAPWRIVIYDMGTDRGPGDEIAVITQPKSVGGSIMYNSPGELHFTLLVDNPQAPLIEPKQTHYAVQFYSGDGWRDVYNGLIWDFDATDTDVVFYGIDYLALFDRVVDDRFLPGKPNLPPEHGGSKYVDRSIDDIVSEQLAYAIGVTNSPVGFIHLGHIDTMDEHVTIWSTMESSLQFVVGLLDSHRQGTGKKTRIRVFYDTTNSQWKVAVDDDAGTTRDNLRLRYGELVQGYRVVPFGTGWASKSNLIGRSLNSAEVFYKKASTPGLDQSVWGRYDVTQVFNNIADENDLQRRVNQAAVHNGKLGKQIGLGLRSGLLLPRSGYDVCDSLPVEIIHSVVDTTRFGSGYWVAYGIAWEGGDDGSSTVILTLLPREDSESPDPDLIPSAPISTQQEWQIGWVPPDPLAGVTSRFWVDQTSGKVYERDESSGTPVYNEITDANIKPAVPSAPTGLALSSTTSVDTNGLPQANLTATIDPITESHVRAVYVEVEW